MQNDIAIRVSNVSKKYLIGKQKDSSLRGSLQGVFNRKSAQGDEFIALNDVSFDIKKGDIVGIIGKNGAGKSTLLKILSQITKPTTGRIEINGRIASLLEVGTGFHPELTGRENIYLNGTILGMSRNEVKSKFDEIVVFSGIEKFVDTPVKHYSSGMYVRLAFSVAAHLEPEILIIDEVLAVGDAEFQTKCLGKMKDVAAEGRTVIFVTHDMSALKSLCPKSMLLEDGKTSCFGETKEIVEKYLNLSNIEKHERNYKKGEEPGDNVACLKSVKLIDFEKKIIKIPSISELFGIRVSIEILQENLILIPNIHIYTIGGNCVFVSHADKSFLPSKRGVYSVTLWIPANTFNDENYVVGVALSSMSPIVVHFHEKEAATFKMFEDKKLRGFIYNGKIPGIIRPILNWEISNGNNE